MTRKRQRVCSERGASPHVTCAKRKRCACGIVGVALLLTGQRQDAGQIHLAYGIRHTAHGIHITSHEAKVKCKMPNVN